MEKSFYVTKISTRNIHFEILNTEQGLWANNFDSILNLNHIKLQQVDFFEVYQNP